ncbi:MAG TPA: wax ester/triacylglycerol synthase family O-acyltransferase, partial [Acidimicrobiales bacterium]|nr:wax ester/triacylglycerol synthase family O-acyltransferase [Acidimicrobiales bacterium]
MTLGVKRLSELDTLFYKAESPSQRFHVLGTLVLDRSAVASGGGYELFQTRVEERFKSIEPLHQRAVWSSWGRHPLWIDDPAVDVRQHLHHVVLPEGGGLDALASVAGDIASYPLAKDKPPWEAWFVEGFEKDKMAVVAKVHHSAVDGVSGISAMAAFFDLEPFPESSDQGPYQAPDHPGVGRLLAAQLSGLGRRPRAVLTGAGRVLSSGLTLARAHGPTTPLPCSGPRLSYNRALTPRRSVGLTTLGLKDIKTVSRASSASVNDIVVALCAGVLRRYAIQCDELPGRPLVAAVPVSERTPEHGAAGNRLSFMFYGLPVHLAEPSARLQFVQRSAHDAKEIYNRGGRGLLSAIAALCPTAVIGPVMQGLSATRAANALPPVANVLISTIRGPELPLYVAGAGLSAIFPMGPLMEGVGLGITAV